MSYPKEAITPGSLNRYIKSMLENDLTLKKLYVVGEISNLKYHSNGNIYFNIKDETAQINCLMFKNYKDKLEVQLKEGDKIELVGSLYTYIKMGQYSINVFKIRKTGQGDLYQKYLELKEQLNKLGYFAEENKKKIPKFPQKIGIITSDTGAAVHDIISTIQRRYPLVKLSIIPTLVQGQNAYKDIVKNIKFAQNYDFDILIIGRGGGSIEDLWAFNEMEVAQEIYNCKIPIISAVGHETDFTIADFVSDKRAPTPTGAAEIATPNKEELVENIQKNFNTINNLLKTKLALDLNKLTIIKQNQYFQNPLLNIQTSHDSLTEKFYNLKNLFLKDLVTKINKVQTNYQLNERYINEIIKNKLTKIEHQKENLDNLNPLNILSKGYTTVKKENEYIKSIKNLKVNDNLTIQLKDGKVNTEIKDIIKEY